MSSPESSVPDSPPQTHLVPADARGQRLDAVAARLFSHYSRSRLQEWIAEGHLLVDGQQRRIRDKLIGGESLLLSVPVESLVEPFDPASLENARGIAAEETNFDTVFEDDSIFVIDKPAGLVMHPAPGNRNGTLMNGLLHKDSSLYQVPRAGIVHRLDKETSGLCVVARNLISHTSLVRQLQAREMGREYLAVVTGDPPFSGTVEAPIARHPKDRKRMAVSEGGKPAVTHYELVERFDACALLRVRLETGRTHQIRVHLTHIGFPLIGDPVYGRRKAVLPRALAENPVIGNFSRQALHATRLTLNHPDSDDVCSFDSPLPEDMQQLLLALRSAAIP